MLHIFRQPLQDCIALYPQDLLRLTVNVTFLLLFLMHLILYYTFVIHQALIPVLSTMDCVAICVFLSHMEVTSAHARQALHLSLMEKPVIMVRFKQGEAGSRGQGGAVLSKISYTWIIGMRKKYQVLL